MLQARRIVIDLVILPGLAPRPVLQPVERALAGHRRTVRTLGLELAGQHMEQRVVTKLIVVVQVFIAEREGEHALADQGLDRVLEQSWVAPVGETAGHPTDQPEAAIQPPQQQPSGIRCDDSAIEPGHNLVPFNRFKFEQCWATLCLHGFRNSQRLACQRVAFQGVRLVPSIAQTMSFHQQLPVWPWVSSFFPWSPPFRPPMLST